MTPLTPVDPLEPVIEKLIAKWRRGIVQLHIDQSLADAEGAVRLGHRIDVYTRCADDLSALLGVDRQERRREQEKDLSHVDSLTQSNLGATGGKNELARALRKAVIRFHDDLEKNYGKIFQAPTKGHLEVFAAACAALALKYGASQGTTAAASSRLRDCTCVGGRNLDCPKHGDPDPDYGF